MCILHDWKYVGIVKAAYWVGGVNGGVVKYRGVAAKQCQKCGKLKEAK